MKHSVEIKEAVKKYKNIFLNFNDSNKELKLSHIDEIRYKAINKLDSLNFPDAKTEEWRKTNIRKLLKEDFKISPVKPYQADFPNEKVISEGDSVKLNFYDGRALRNKEFYDDLPPGVLITNLQDAINSNPELVLKYFDSISDYSTGFDAVNSAFVKDGLFIYLPDGAVVTRPIEVLFYFEKEAELSSLRNLIVLGNNAGMDLIIHYKGKSSAKYFVSSINEITLGRNSVLNIYEVQNQSSNSYHVQKSVIYQAESSNVSHFEFTFNGGLIRNDIYSILDGENIECNLMGLYIGKGKQHIDNHTEIKHLKPNCNSNELYKGILKDNAHGVFTGKIFVEPVAQKTNAYQSNKNILLNNTALVDTKPQLEIYADDVKCSHGATVGKLDELALFYLKSRGIPEEIAKSMLIQAFASDVIEFVKIKNLKEYLNTKIAENLKEVNLPSL